jgi:hypothetical protein
MVPTQRGRVPADGDIEPLKPSNTGWLIADVVADTFAFGWARTEVDPALLALLADPQWQPYVVFPGEFVAPERVVTRCSMPLLPWAKPSARCLCCWTPPGPRRARCFAKAPISTTCRC